MLRYIGFHRSRSVWGASFPSWKPYPSGYAQAGKKPGTLVAGLTDPNSFPSDTVDSSTAASNTVLAANTGYSLTWPSATISN